MQERNIYRFVQLVPGAHEGALSSSANGTRPDERRQTVAVSVNGATDIENNHMIDGADNNERLQGTAGVRVSLDAVAEVKVQTNLYAAELGRTSGAVINIITKSGTNEFHGSGFEFAPTRPIRLAPVLRNSGPRAGSRMRLAGAWAARFAATGRSSLPTTKATASRMGSPTC